MADLIRTSVDRLLREKGHQDHGALKQRALAAAGKLHSGLGDLAAEHDRYLADTFEP